MELEEIWKDLRNDITTNRFDMSCVFNKINAKVNFKIIVKT